ncbi:MAG: chitobiase/beta-hexosaminidase C-terminal domain-containing protein [Bacteroidota bacterium]|nr:chitobiase/beta-hexosaminidase C-terminal domain-containing protein [Bacteroidota bacterium]
MKRYSKIFLCSFLLAILCCLGTSLSAQISVDSLRFRTVFDSLKTVGGGTMNLTTDMPVRMVAHQTYALESDVSNPIQINTNQFKIISIGDNVTADSTILRIGDNVSILGTSTVIANLNRGIIRINGGLIKSTTSISGTSAVIANAGWIYVSGGTISVEATGVTTACALNVLNSFSLVLRGGTISAFGDNTRALSLTDGVTNIANIIKPFSGGTITASGNGAYGIQSLGVNSLTIGDNTTVTTTSTNGTDAALVGGGASSLIVIPSTSQNVNISSSISYKLDNTGAAVLDMRGATLTANPVDGSSLTYPTNNVVLTASGNASMAKASIYYSNVVNPTTTSPTIDSGGSVPANSASTIIKAAIGKNGYIDPTVYTFNYTVSGLPANLPINVSSLADLQAAYTTSLTATDTTRIKLLANITINAALTMTPDATHPIVIDANGFSLIVAANTTIGGSIKVSSNTTAEIIKITGATVTNITGGTYTVNGNAPIIYANSGSGVDNTATKLYLSNSTFTVNGTSNGASIVKYATSNGNVISSTGCTFNDSAKAVAFNLVGPINLNFSNSTLNVAGSDAASIAISYAPTNAAPNTVIFDGLTVNMTAGKVLVLAGTKALNSVIKNLTVSSTTPTLYAYNGTGVSKFYDFRAFTPTASPASAQYRTDPNVTLTLASTFVLPVDAAGASIVYTLDGTDPVASSAVYSAPINFTSGTIKAAAYKDGFLGTIYTFIYSAAGEPITSAPTPPIYATPKVISIFSDAYTNVAGTDFNPNWGQAGSDVIIQLAANNTLKMANLNYQGIQFGTPVNALPMNYLHLDAFSPNETSLQVFCISASTGEKSFQLTPLNLGTWNSYDIPLSAFTSQGLSVSDLIQFKFVGAGGNTIYLDNLYFYNSDPTPDTQVPTAFAAEKGAIASDAVELLLNATDDSGAILYTISYGDIPTVVTTAGISGIQKSFTLSGLSASTDYSFSVTASDPTGNVAANNPIVVTTRTLTPLPAAPTPAVDAAKVISIFSDAYTNVAGTDFNPGWGQSTVESQVQLSGNNAIKYMNLNYQGIALANSVDASVMSKLHVDIYPVDETSLQITPISPATPANKEFSVALTPLNLNAWNSYDILLSSFAGVDLSQVFQFKFTGSGGKTVYMDNLYFYNDATGISTVGGSNSISCFPNPVLNQLTISAQSDIRHIVISNLLGQFVKSTLVNGLGKTIDTSDLTAGNYFITVKLANGQLSTQKLVKL